jgi:hypothetical protein
MSSRGEDEGEDEVGAVDRPTEATTTVIAMVEVGEGVIQSATGTGTTVGEAGVGIMTGIITIDEGLTIGLRRDRTDLHILHVEVQCHP